MTEERIHRAVAEDGTPIVGSVHGTGPALVLVHGAVADGGSEWAELLPHLTDRFTCYVPSLRGRGRSGDHPDHSRQARLQDVVAFVRSIGGPVGLVGVSGGGMLVLGAAARLPGLTAVVAREPVLYEVLDDDLRAEFERATDHMAEAVDQGRRTEAVQPFLALVGNDEEMAALSEDPEALEAASRYLEADIAEFREGFDGSGPSPTDPAVLASVAAPVLLLRGPQTALRWFSDSVDTAAEHLPDATVREIPGTGHLGHLLYPERDAAEILAFVEAAHQPA